MDNSIKYVLNTHAFVAPFFHNLTTHFPKIYIQQTGKRKIPKKTVTETKANQSRDT
jgi:hypothetical protein